MEEHNADNDAGRTVEVAVEPSAASVDRGGGVGVLDRPAGPAPALPLQVRVAGAYTRSDFSSS